MYLGLIQAGLHATRRFHADFTQILGRMHRKILAESQRNPGGVVPEWFWNRSRIVPESSRNLSSSLAESIPALSRLDSMQPEDFMQISRRFYGEWVA